MMEGRISNIRFAYEPVGSLGGATITDGSGKAVAFVSKERRNDDEIDSVGRLLAAAPALEAALVGLLALVEDEAPKEWIEESGAVWDATAKALKALDLSAAKVPVIPPKVAAQITKEAVFYGTSAVEDSMPALIERDMLDLVKHEKRMESYRKDRGC